MKVMAMTGETARIQYTGCKAALATLRFLTALRLKGKTITADAAKRMVERDEFPVTIREDCREFAALIAETPVPWSTWTDGAMEVRYNAICEERDRLYVDAVEEEYQRIRGRQVQGQTDEWIY